MDIVAYLTYAAVAANISTLRAFVKTDSITEKIAIKMINTPRRVNVPKGVGSRLVDFCGTGAFSSGRLPLGNPPHLLITREYTIFVSLPQNSPVTET